MLSSKIPGWSTFLNHDDEDIYNGGQFVRLCCVRRRVMLMSAYLGPFDKQHGQGDGAVKCHGNEP